MAAVVAQQVGICATTANQTVIASATFQQVGTGPTAQLIARRRSLDETRTIPLIDQVASRSFAPQAIQVDRLSIGKDKSVYGSVAGG